MGGPSLEDLRTPFLGNKNYSQEFGFVGVFPFTYPILVKEWLELSEFKRDIRPLFHLHTVYEVFCSFFLVFHSVVCNYVSLTAYLNCIIYFGCALVLPKPRGIKERGFGSKQTGLR